LCRLSGSGGEAELLCLEALGRGEYRCLARPMKRLRPGRRLLLGQGLSAEVIERLSDCELRVSFVCADGRSVENALAAAGLMPIPPYIRRGRADSGDVEDYQTFFARAAGSVAAPTAGLHFTPELCRAIEAKGCTIAYVTLHVGPASFLPLADGSGKELRHPGSERYVHSPELLQRIGAARAGGGRVVAVGTTVVRALESMILREGGPAGPAATDLFIRPGFRFKAVDVLVTNFHQPRTTHLLLVEAFMGRALLEASYAHALGGGYRFLSYGDGMVIV